jgi:hypothetical protein
MTGPNACVMLNCSRYGTQIPQPALREPAPSPEKADTRQCECAGRPTWQACKEAELSQLP